MSNDELRRIRPGQRIVWRRVTNEPVELLLVEEVLARYEQRLSDIGIGYRWYQDSSGCSLSTRIAIAGVLSGN